MSAFSTPLCREGLVAFGDSVAERAADLDMGVADTRADIASAGAAGLLHHGIDGGDLSTMVEIIESTSIASLSVGFSLWAQRMTAEYVARATGSA
ncbi:hypothetical protein BKA16_000244 [Gordonia humi]|uniref:Uncharacterized protein n=1 Tax=Gordonia humi TaxID=686429 RepID=A0A840EPS6_9ACTN|nr:hypothetical protein [Gordonia humi]